MSFLENNMLAYINILAYLSQCNLNMERLDKKFRRDNIDDVCGVIWAINEFYKLPNQSRLNFFDEIEEFIVEQIEKSLD